MAIFSKKVEVKPGVFRNVHIRENGRATWVIAYQGKLVAVSGEVIEDKFVANQKWQHVIDAYVPRRITSKGNAEIKTVHRVYPISVEAKQRRAARRQVRYKEAKQLPAIFVMVGSEQRKVFRKSMTSGIVSYDNNRISGAIRDGQFIPYPKWTAYWNKINQLG